jgi:chromosome segregation ATPase
MESSNQRDELDTYKTELKGLSMQVEYLKKDKDKLQQVVKRFHEDRIEMKRRMKAKVDMLRVHEEALVSKDMEVSSMHARMEEIESTIEGLRNELSNKEKQVEEMKIALIDQKKTLESNQQVITWLNKEINNFHKGGSGLSAVYNNTDELLKGISNNMESSLVRFNSSRTMGGFSGPLFHAYPSSFMNTELEKTPTKNTGIRIEGSPKFTHSLQNPTYIPEPQPYVPRDKIIA